MTRILICDDEGIVQESLKFIISKSFGEECIVQSAKNGRKAIELAESFYPDIILMDIQMPGINGIEAMQEIRRENKNVVFIVLTAYDKFEYSQKSISIGVLEYLTKPINRDYVVEVLRKAIRTVKERREKASHELEVKEKLEAVIPLIESGFVYSVLMEGDRNRQEQGYQELLGLSVDYGYAMVIECGDDLHKGVLSNTVGAGIRLQKHYMIFRELIKESTEGIVGSLMANKAIIFVPCESTCEQYDERLIKIENTRGLLRKMEQQINLKFKAGIGSVRKWSAMEESYKEALEAVRQGVGKVVHANDLSVGCTYEESYPYELEQELFAAVSRGEVENTIELSEKFMEWMFESTSSLNDGVRLKAMEFVLFAERTAYLQGGIVYHFEDRNGYLDMLNSFQSYEELTRWFIGKMGDACRHVAMKREEKSDSLIEKAKAYIEEYFDKELSLEEMAKEVNISPYYLSKLFKETEGVNYIEYVTKLRINYAKDRLKNSSMSIKEICHLSGYSDPNYFSRIFKKWTGVTPTEYREGGITSC